MAPLNPVLRRFVLLLWIISVLTVVYFSVTPKLEFPYTFDHADKIYHMLSYLWLSALPFFAFSGRGAVLAGGLAMIPLGIVLEFVQAYVPGRSFSLLDMAADCLGVVLGMWLAPHAVRVCATRTFRAGAK